MSNVGPAGDAVDGDAMGAQERVRKRANDVYQRLLDERILFLGTQIDDAVSNLVVSQPLLLQSMDASKDVFLYINCPGGWVSPAMAIYDTIQYVSCDVGTICLGLASGMGQLLLCAGAKGKRYALPNSRICMRAPSFPQPDEEVDLLARGGQAQRLIYIRRIWAARIAHHTGHRVEQVEIDSERDRWFTPEEAREYGIIDHVIPRSRQVRL